MPHVPLQLAILSRVPVTGSAQAVGGVPAQHYADFDEFLLAPARPDAFVIRADDPGYAQRTLRQLRRHPDHATALAFVDGDIAEADRAVSDGALPVGARGLADRIEQTRSRALAIHRRNHNRAPDARLLEYLWLRPDYVLEPYADWQHPLRYRYPVVEALDRSDSDPFMWLERLQRDELIESVALRDRQRECDFCRSAHLSFIDICPNCRGIEVDRHMALHCFNCGLIAPEGRFIRGDQRQCPKCATRLRHIGSDYDRPLETSVCSTCDHVFVEGEVEARCTICRHTMASTRLRQRKIHSWRLSGLGCLAAQGDGPLDPAPAIASQGYLPYRQFVGSLEWSLRLARDGFGFSVAALHLDNLAELERTLGVGTTATLLDGCAERLREALDDADLATRADTETTLLLLPGAARKRLAALQAELTRIAEQATQDRGIRPRWRLADRRPSRGDAELLDARELLQGLRDSFGTARRAPLAV